MKNRFRFSKNLIYVKVLLALTLIVTIVTSSMPMIYAETNTTNALTNPDFETTAGWVKSGGEITLATGEGIDSTNALKLAGDENAVYQTITKSDNSNFIHGSTFNWEFNFKSSANDIVALILGTAEPSGNPDHFRKMLTWLNSNKKVNKNIPANGQYQVIVYSKPFKAGGIFDNGKFGSLRADFSLTPTMYCTEKWTVVLSRTNTGEWTTVTNPATTPYTLVKDTSSICYSLLSYNGDILVDNASFFIEKTGDVVTEFNNLQNGSFETPTIPSGYYSQPTQSNVPYWSTTAYGNKIEYFKAEGNGKAGHFCTGNNIRVVDGSQAAELNADEASTLYQYIKTESESQYKWRLSHRGRHGADIMALVIGPKQSVDPSKDSKNGSDQFMKMVEWVKENKDYYPDVKDDITKIEKAQKDNELKTSDYRCTPVKVTVYSKKFSTSGGFDSNNTTYFSATESTVFSQRWDVTILCSGNDNWQTYGENDDDRYSYYEVPEGQTDSIFAFTAYKGTNQYNDKYYIDNPTQADKQNTYGNLLDGINFDLYYPASSVSFTGGDAVLSYVYKGDLKESQLISGEPAQSIMVDEDSTFTLDVTPRYSTTIDKNGNETPRLDANGNPIQNTFLGAYITVGGKRQYYPATAIGSDNAVYFSETEGENGMKTYSYGKSNVSGRVVVELVYSEVYTIIYNSKGGKAYSVSDGSCTGDMDWQGNNSNIARFYEKAAGVYTSTDCRWWEDNPSVVFKGWELVGGKIKRLSDNSTVSEDEKVLFAGNATVSYTPPAPLTDEEKKGLTPEQQEELFLEKARQVDFIITDGVYEGRINAYSGGVLVANWEYKTSVIAQTEQLDGSFINSGVGGQVALTDHTMDVTDINGTVYSGDDIINYTDKFTFTSAFYNVVKSSQQENEGYKFLGWYDKNGIKLSATSDHSFTMVPYFITDDKANAYQTPSVVYARFGFEYKVKFHINDKDTVSTVGNPNADLYRVYYPQGVDISHASSPDIDYAIMNLDSNNKIQYFYDIPVPKSTCGKIFKGWYTDIDNNSDTHPIQWNNKAYTEETDIYAHWIDVGTVQQDADDKKIIDSDNRPFVNENEANNSLLWGFDLLGVQIRYEDEDENYPNGRGTGEGQTPHFDTDGLRFVTCLKEDVLRQSGALFNKTYTDFTTKQPLRYGYVVAKESTANSKLTSSDTIEYSDANVNGVDTRSKYSFVTNVDCTSSVGGYKNTTIKDHENFRDYRVYSMVISYNTAGKSDSEIESAKRQNIIARPYLRYQDANGLYRTYYQNYTGTNVRGGCSTNYNFTRDYLQDKGYFPATQPTEPTP